MQYTDKLNNTYKIVNGRPMVWGFPESYHSSVFVEL